MGKNDGKIIVTFAWLQGFFNVKAIMRRFKAKNNELKIEVSEVVLGGRGIIHSRTTFCI